MTILLVDDDPDVLEVVRELLQTSGHVVLTCESAIRALEILDREPVDVVITDWMMPRMSGLELVRRIRAAGRQRYTWLIVLTALGGTSHYVEGMRAGADDFITKPVTGEDLEVRLAVAARVLGLQERVRMLQGFISICMYCKSVRITDDAWTSIEDYVEQHSDASFSHGICPTCYETQVRPQLEPPAGPAA